MTYIYIYMIYIKTIKNSSFRTEGIISFLKFIIIFFGVVGGGQPNLEYQQSMFFTFRNPIRSVCFSFLFVDLLFFPLLFVFLSFIYLEIFKSKLHVDRSNVLREDILKVFVCYLVLNFYFKNEKVKYITFVVYLRQLCSFPIFLFIHNVLKGVHSNPLARQNVCEIHTYCW